MDGCLGQIWYARLATVLSLFRENGSHMSFQEPSSLTISLARRGVLLTAVLLPLAVCSLQLWQLFSLYEQTSVLALLLDRMEPDYLPMLMQTVEGKLTGTGVLEPEEGFVRPVPYGSFILHSLLIRVFGLKIGFISADLLATLLAFLAWAFVLYRLTGNQLVSVVAACLITTGFIDHGLAAWQRSLPLSFGRHHLLWIVIATAMALGCYLFRRLTGRLPSLLILTAVATLLVSLILHYQSMPGEIYNDRFPRPFVSCIPYLLSLGMLLQFGSQPHSRLWMNGALAGLAFGWLFAADPFSFMICALLAVAVYFKVVYSERRLEWPWIGAAMVGFVIISCPLWYLQMLTSPEYLRRVGGDAEQNWFPYVNSGTLLAIMTLVLFCLLLNSGGYRKWLVTLIPVAALLGPPAFMLTGQHIQLWHYFVLIPAAVATSMIMLLSLLASEASERVTYSRNRLVLAYASLALCLIPVAFWCAEDKPAVYYSSFQRGKHTIGNNRPMVEVANWLDTRNYPADTVLGSTSNQPIAYWQSSGRPVLNPLAFSSSLSNLQLIGRVAHLLRLTRMYEPEAREFLFSKKRGPGFMFIWNYDYALREALSDTESGLWSLRTQRRPRCDVLVIDKAILDASQVEGTMVFENERYSIVEL